MSINKYTIHKTQHRLMIGFGWTIFMMCSVYQSVNAQEQLYSQSFESLPIGTQWIRPQTVVEAVAGDKVLKVAYEPASNGSPRLTKKFNLGLGHSEATLSFKLKFDKEFEFVKGGKLHGLGGGTTTTGCTPIDPNGWSVRMTWASGGRPKLYLYHQDRTNVCGDSASEYSGFEFSRDIWHQIDIYVRVNSAVGSQDGMASLHIDGVKQAERTGLNLTGNLDKKIEKFLFNTFYGGNDSTWSPSKTTFVYYDDFIVHKGQVVTRIDAEESQLCIPIQTKLKSVSLVCL